MSTKNVVKGKELFGVLYLKLIPWRRGLPMELTRQFWDKPNQIFRTDRKVWHLSMAGWLFSLKLFVQACNWTASIWNYWYDHTFCLLLSSWMIWIGLFFFQFHPLLFLFIFMVNFFVKIPLYRCMLCSLYWISMY